MHQCLGQLDNRLKILSAKKLEPSAKSPMNESIFLERREKIRSICELEVPKDKAVPKLDQILVLKSHKLAWCPVFKAGSSTWISILLKIADQDLVRFFEIHMAKKSYLLLR